MMDRKPAIRKIIFILFLGRILAGSCLSADIQTAQNIDPDKSAGSKQTEPSRVSDWLDIGFEHRIRYEALDNRFRLGETGDDRQLPIRTRFSLGLMIKPVHFKFEFQDSRIFLDDEGSTVDNSMVNELDVQQLHVGLALNEITGSHRANMIVFGRQSFDLGGRRLFARNRFRNTTNAYNGLRWSYGITDRWAIDAFAFQPIGRRFDVRDRGERGTYLWGGLLAGRIQPLINAEFYYFGYKKSFSNPELPRLRYDTIGGRLFRWDGAGTFGYELETMWQFGTVGSLAHFAHSHHISLGYNFDTSWEPILKGQYDYASGDSDPADDRSGTFDKLYGARRFEFGPTGIYGWIFRSNTGTPGVRLILRPSPGLELVSAYRWAWLAQSRDYWIGTGLRDTTGRSGSYIGSQVELRLRYDPRDYFRAELGYARFFKGSYPKRVSGSPATGDSNYFYIQLIFRIQDLLK